MSLFSNKFNLTESIIFSGTNLNIRLKSFISLIFSSIISIKSFILFLSILCHIFLKLAKSFSSKASILIALKIFKSFGG